MRKKLAEAAMWAALFAVAYVGLLEGAFSANGLGNNGVPPFFGVPLNGCPSAGSASTFNPSDKSATILLTCSNLKAANSNTTNGGVRGTLSRAHSSGQWLIEFTTTGSGGVNSSVGITTGASNLGNIGNAPVNSFLYYISGGIWFNNANTFNAVAPTAHGCLAIDMTNLKGWARAESSNAWNGGVGTPVLGTGSQDLSSVFTSNAAFPVATFNSATVSYTVNFGGTAFAFGCTGADVVGFNPWG